MSKSLRYLRRADSSRLNYEIIVLSGLFVALVSFGGCAGGTRGTGGDSRLRGAPTGSTSSSDGVLDWSWLTSSSCALPGGGDLSIRNEFKKLSCVTAPPAGPPVAPPAATDMLQSAVPPQSDRVELTINGSFAERGRYKLERVGCDGRTETLEERDFRPSAPQIVLEALRWRSSHFYRLSLVGRQSRSVTLKLIPQSTVNGACGQTK